MWISASRSIGRIHPSLVNWPRSPTRYSVKSVLVPEPSLNVSLSTNVGHTLEVGEGRHLAHPERLGFERRRPGHLHRFAVGEVAVLEGVTVDLVSQLRVTGLERHHARRQRDAQLEQLRIAGAGPLAERGEGIKGQVGREATAAAL